MPPKTLTRAAERKARLFGLFADPTRLQILKFLSRHPKTSAGKIAKHVGMSAACTSHHLQLLKDNAVAECRREGNTIFYCLKKDKIVKTLVSLIN